MDNSSSRKQFELTDKTHQVIDLKVKLSIIIVNWNGMGYLLGCLESIVKNPPSVSYEIVVVDNESTDSSLEWLKSEKCRLLLQGASFRLIESGGNLGFGKANNLAFERTDSPYLLLLNPDTIVTGEAIDNLLNTIESNPKAGLVAPKLLNEDDSVQASVWGPPANPLILIVTYFRLGRFLPRKWLKTWLYSTYWDYAQRSKVPAFSGAVMLARRKMIEEAGGFDPSFHMYGEDMEWCARIRRYGWKLFFEPEAKIYHIGGKSSAQRWKEDKARIEQEKAFILFQKKCLPKYLTALNSFTKMMIFGSFMLKQKILGKDASLFFQLFRLYFNSLFFSKSKTS